MMCSQKFEKGEKWLKQEADMGWVEVIGSYTDATVTATRRVDPCRQTMRDAPDCDEEPYYETYQTTHQ
jgi:hypothetical protein